MDKITTQNSQLLDGYMTRNQLATELGVSTRTIDRWFAYRKIVGRAKLGKQIYYKIEEVQKCIEKACAKFK